MSEAIVEYSAADGCEVKLTPAIVAKYIVTGNAKVPDKDVYSFMMKCKARGLNPLAGDCYMTCYQNQRTGDISTSVITSKDYFVRTACAQETFDGMQAGVVIVKSDGSMERREGSLVGNTTERLVGGWAKVYVKNRQIPSYSEVSLGEYSTGKNLWASKPATMIRKVALVQAIREAYPEQFGGIYDRDEMPEPIAAPTTQEVEVNDEYEEQF